MTHIEAFAHEGAAFVYGGLMTDNHAGGSVPDSSEVLYLFRFQRVGDYHLSMCLVGYLLSLWHYATNCFFHC